MTDFQKQYKFPFDAYFDWGGVTTRTDYFFRGLITYNSKYNF